MFTVLVGEARYSDLARVFGLSEFLHFLHTLTFVSFALIRQHPCLRSLHDLVITVVILEPDVPVALRFVGTGIDRYFGTKDLSKLFKELVQVSAGN